MLDVFMPVTIYYPKTPYPKAFPLFQLPINIKHTFLNKKKISKINYLPSLFSEPLQETNTFFLDLIE